MSTLPDLTEADYDALYAMVSNEMPGVSREIFPKLLEQFADNDLIVITVTDEEISLSMPHAPQYGPYVARRKRTL